MNGIFEEIRGRIGAHPEAMCTVTHHPGGNKMVKETMLYKACSACYVGYVWNVCMPRRHLVTHRVHHEACRKMIIAFLPEQRTFLQKNRLVIEMSPAQYLYHDCIAHFVSRPVPVSGSLAGYCSECRGAHETEKRRLILCVLVLRRVALSDIASVVAQFMVSL
jgi:hypothetical protein